MAFLRRGNVLPLLGFESQTVKPIAGRSTDYANQAPFILRRKINFKNLLMRISHFISNKNIDLEAGYCANMAEV